MVFISNKLDNLTAAYFVIENNQMFQIGHVGDLPKELSEVEGFESNEEFLKKVHHVVMEV